MITKVNFGKRISDLRIGGGDKQRNVKWTWGWDRPGVI